MFEHDVEFELSGPQTTEIHVGSWITDEDKMRRLAESDGVAVAKVKKDAIVGMIVERGGHIWVSQDHKCEQPDFGVVERNDKIWGKDLVLLEDLRIKTASGQEQVVMRSVTCKGQFYSMTREVLRHTEPSWTFQLKTTGRFADPMLSDPHCNKLFIAGWVDDGWKDGKNVNQLYPSTVCKLGFRWRPRMVCFWWPDVFPHLADPQREDLRKKKRALYYKDIKHLRAEILSP